MQVNVRQIEIFKAIMEGGSVTQAASNLNIAQPSVSKHLKLLEIDLGFDLFRRRGNKLDATPEGQALFDQVERVYTGLGFLSDFAEDLRNNQLGELSIASMPLMAQKWLPSCVASFVATHRKVSLSLPVRSSSWIATAVAARRVHFGMGLRPSDADTGIHVVPLIKLPLVCVMAPDHPLAEHTEIQLHHMQDHSLISLDSFEGQPLVLENLTNGTQANTVATIISLSLYWLDRLKMVWNAFHLDMSRQLRHPRLADKGRITDVMHAIGMLPARPSTWYALLCEVTIGPTNTLGPQWPAKRN